MRVAWLTDIHLDHLTGAGAVPSFAHDVAKTEFDGAVITGDISTAVTLQRDLHALAAVWQRPVWFVLGNHDFYGSGITEVRKHMERVRGHQFLKYLPQEGVVKLAQSVCLVGVDGWGDGRLGAPETTDVFLNDFIHIRELALLRGAELLSEVRRLGDEEAARCRELLSQAVVQADKVVVATHIPPFRESCWHRGAMCRAVGPYGMAE